jgi:hypothetical protein
MSNSTLITSNISGNESTAGKVGDQEWNDSECETAKCKRQINHMVPELG